MSNFKVGQKVVCVVSSWKVYKHNTRLGNLKLYLGIKIKSVGPKKDEMVTIAGFDDGFLILKEFPNQTYGVYMPDCFRPLDHQFAENLLAEITESVKQDELVEL